jgi:hypothetical protein
MLFGWTLCFADLNNTSFIISTNYFVKFQKYLVVSIEQNNLVGSNKICVFQQNFFFSGCSTHRENDLLGCRIPVYLVKIYFIKITFFYLYETLFL